VQLAVNIVVLAAIYALIACGYVLIYRVSRVLNLAHGELMMLGAYLLMVTASLFVGHPLVAIGMAALLSLVVGGLVYGLLLRRMTGEVVLAAVLVTVALGIALRGAIVLIWSPQQLYPLRALEPSTQCCSVSCASAAGASACARRARTRCSRHSAASTCTASTRSPGGCRHSPGHWPAS
jgi:branched-subunit amino acid ABC-type transport system permease component